MRRFNALSCMLLAGLLLAIQPPTVRAAIVISGDVDPADADDWDIDTEGYVGDTGHGTLKINRGSEFDSYLGYIGYGAGSTGVVTVDGADSTWFNDSDLCVGFSGKGTLNITRGGAVECMSYYLFPSSGYIGYESGSTGTVTVDGKGSTWTIADDLYVGDYGSGTLKITNGGTVWVDYSTYVAHEPDSTGLIDFGPRGGTLDTGTLYASPTQLRGTGTIDTAGLVSDVDLVFDQDHGLKQSLTLSNDARQNITVNLDLSGGDDDLGAGYQGNGSLSIRDGITVDSDWGYVGYHSGSTGAVTVDGAGSTWANSGDLYIGLFGSGTLEITGGAAVSAGGCTFVALETGSKGAIRFGPGGGTLTTRSLYASPAQLRGTGTIDARGLVSDVDLVFDPTHGLNQTFTFNSQPDQNVTINLDISGTSGNVGELGAGYRGDGSLSIRDGTAVDSDWGYIGDRSGSTGTATVDGAGSTWTISDDLIVGLFGRGTLGISGGAAVSNSSGYIAYESGSTGAVTVEGAGSTWANSSDLYVGDDGSGVLRITGGGGVTAEGVSITDQSLLAIDVGRGSSLTVDGGSGTIDNGGIVRVVAGPGVTTGSVYSPIAAETWEGTGVYQALGGTWDNGNHRFTVSAVQKGTSGTMEPIDLAQVQRALISDEGTGWSVGAGLLAAESAELYLTAAAIDGTNLADLQSLLDDGESVLGGWTFTLTGKGYSQGDPVYLSFNVGAGFSRSGLNVWHYDGSQWTEYAAADLTYDGQYASFTVTGLGSYAVSAGP